MSGFENKSVIDRFGFSNDAKESALAYVAQVANFN